MWLRKVSPKIWKWVTPTIKHKKVTANSSLELWKEGICHWINTSEKLNSSSSGMCIHCMQTPQALSISCSIFDF